MTRVNPENYITVQGWMVTDLNLKGNELLIYACIYGFSQAENQVFNGGLQYLADWTNTTKRSVITCLKSLVDKGYLLKNEKVIGGVKFCEYYGTKFTTPVKNFHRPGEESSTGGGEESSPNNKDLNKQVDIKDIKAIISYLNEKTGSKYSYKTQKTQDAIRARFNEIDGLTVEDFKTVIDKKCAEWLGDEKMAKYLRPETLFGPKFEGYLNQKQATPKGRKEIVPEWMTEQRMASTKKSMADMDDLLAMVKRTAGNDPGIAARAERLKESLGGG